MADPWQSLELSAFSFTVVVCMKSKMGQVEQCSLIVHFQMDEMCA